MNTSNENKDKTEQLQRYLKSKTFIRGKKSKGFLEINQELCELNKVYDDFKITSIRKNRFETDCIGNKIQLYKLIVEKDGIESILELGWEDSFSLSRDTIFFSLIYPEEIRLPRVVSFAWIKAEGPTQRDLRVLLPEGREIRENIHVDLKILWNTETQSFVPEGGWKRK